MIALEITQCGPGVSVQDTGRYGYRRFGMSTAGAMDQRSLALANALVGNPLEAAAVELPLSGAAFRVIGCSVVVAACGPGTTLAVSGEPVSEHTSVQAFDGDTIAIGPPKYGVYSYLAVAGGIQTISVLESRSCHRRSGTGGDVLSPGDRLPCLERTSDKSLCFLGKINSDCGEPIRIVAGPQVDMFEEEARSHLLSARYRINPRSDRMGIRLDGPALRCPQGHDIVSEGVAPGSIQVPGDGNPIVLGRDCQTTGGYPKIATVISADLDRLAQIPIGSEVRFSLVSVGEAIDAAHYSAHWRNSLTAAVQSVSDPSLNLLSYNLIGGVTNGDDL